MELENTLENKAKVFALYWGQKVISEPFKKELEYNYTSNITPGSKLFVKPISSISDEDKVHLGLEYAVSFDEYGYNYSIGGDSWDIDQVDYLRSKGYALPAFGLSVEELVNRGWYVLEK